MQQHNEELVVGFFILSPYKPPWRGKTHLRFPSHISSTLVFLELFKQRLMLRRNIGLESHSKLFEITSRVASPTKKFVTYKKDYLRNLIPNTVIILNPHQ